MISAKITKLLNEKIVVEQTNELIYSAARAWFESQNFRGFAKYFRTQAQEEYEHKQKVIDYMADAQCKIEILPVNNPKIAFKSVIEIVNKYVEVEWETLKQYEELKGAAEKESDGLTYDFAMEMIHIQREEIANASDMQYEVTRVVGTDKFLTGIGLNQIDARLQG